MGEARKLFFGLFIFPLLITMGMAVLLCSAVILTREEETPESLIAAVKTGSAGKRWQKAFELSNELNRAPGSLRNEGVMKEIISILRDDARYDSKTRSYMAMALAHFPKPEAVEALTKSLKDPSEDVQIYSLWALGALGAKEAVPEVLPFLTAQSSSVRKTSVYALGVIGGEKEIPDLKPLLKDPAADVRWNTALSLARLGNDAGYETLVEMLRREELAERHGLTEVQIETVITNAIKGLALIRRPESLKIFQTLSQTDKSMKVRQAALEAVRYQKDASSGKITQ